MFQLEGFKFFFEALYFQLKRHFRLDEIPHLGLHEALIVQPIPLS